MPFDVQHAREQFPALQQLERGRPPIFLDNPAGTQVPQAVIAAVSQYFREDNSNSGGYFATSRRTDALKAAARQTLAAFLNASRPEEIVFGANMTTLTFQMSRAIGRTLKPGQEIILTQMDHDANISPWALMAEDRGLVVRWVRLDPETGTLDQASYRAALNENTRLVCVGHAANALGTVNPIREMADLAHQAGAYVYVDAVQSAPHVLVDVQALGADFLVCSAYKFYGPHVGVLYGRHELLESLPAYKVRPAGDSSPDKWETGTGSYETIAGTKAAVEYLASWGEGETLRARLADSYRQIMDYEGQLTWQLIEGLLSLPQIEIRGIIDPTQAHYRVPTVIFRLSGCSPQAVAQALADEAIYVWSGHYYAVETIKALGHEKDGGLVRMGIAHYNTADEIRRSLEILKTLSK
jgi:cysteine desulfurase family protein (TIGR01976 family)